MYHAVDLAIMRDILPCYPSHVNVGDARISASNVPTRLRKRLLMRTRLLRASS